MAHILLKTSIRSVVSLSATLISTESACSPGPTRPLTSSTSRPRPAPSRRSTFSRALASVCFYSRFEDTAYLPHSTLGVFLGLSAVNPTSNLLYFGTADSLASNASTFCNLFASYYYYFIFFQLRLISSHSLCAVVTVVNVQSKAVVSNTPIQGMVTGAWAYSN